MKPYQPMFEFQSRGRGLRAMENQLEVPFISIENYERLKKVHESNAVKTDVYGNLIHTYTLH